ncbi:MAG TPA: uroporphyrinogen-III C-methyltransferase [Gemmatimonadaceae bacterium]|jgi:uroporphyrinogen III methyltransferase/synthase
MAERARNGKVYLVGAGPGDALLLTVRARELIESADAIVYHSRALSPLLPADAKERGHPEIYFVGESRSGKRPSRETVNALLADLARSGKKVVRLMRGDPLFLNRGSEEAQHLNDCAIEFEIVPGIAEGIAAADQSGIPLTHTDLSSSVVFIDSRKFADQSARVARPLTTDTIVIGPGVDSLPEIAKELMQAGMSPDIPAATVQHAGTARQQVVTGKLETIAQVSRDAGIVGRAVTIVGYTVVLGYELGWLDRRPLFGKRVALADPPSVSGRLGAMLRELGAEVSDMPEALSQRLHVEWEREAWDTLDGLRWLAFVGADAVAIFWEHLLGSGRDARALAAQKIAAVGAPTVRALLERGITVDVTPSRFDAESVAAALRERADIRGSRLLLVASDDVDETFRAGLENAGASVHVITTSRHLADERAMGRWKESLTRHPPDAVAFTSPRAVRRFAESLSDDVEARWTNLSIGGATSAAIREARMKIGSEAEEPTLSSVVEAIRRALE